MLLLWSEKEYGLLTSNPLRLGLLDFSNNGLTFSFNCEFTSDILWVEKYTWKKIITVGFMLRAFRLLLAKRHVSQYSRIRNLLRSPDHKEELYAKIFRINCWKGELSNYWTCFMFEAIYILKCWTHLRFCGLKRTAWRWYTGSRTLIFLQNGFFSQSLTYTPEIYE